MAWRRRKNGWPYADVMVKGKRHRGSLLLPREADTPGLWPDDEACERRYQNWLRLDLPRMMEGEKQPEKKEATLQDLVDAKLADLEARLLPKSVMQASISVASQTVTMWPSKTGIMGSWSSGCAKHHYSRRANE